MSRELDREEGESAEHFPGRLRRELRALAPCRRVGDGPGPRALKREILATQRGDGAPVNLPVQAKGR
jgi:hypothetical protein